MKNPKLLKLGEEYEEAEKKLLLRKRASDDLVSHGSSGGECYGRYNSTTGIGKGAGYVNSCIHSGIVVAEDTYSGVDTPTVWYNYSIASAGTIKDTSSTGNADNLNTATESICPKGWTLPTKNQLGANRTPANFNPLLGGNYSDGAKAAPMYGYWWGSEAINGAARHDMHYYNGSLASGNINRRAGVYIRCVSEEKTVTDLTYMQDMTASITL